MTLTNQHLQAEPAVPMEWQAGEEFTDDVNVVAAFYDKTTDAISLWVQWSTPKDGQQWENNGITEEVIGSTKLDCSCAALNLDAEMVGKQIRIYWPKEKRWYAGTIKSYDRDENQHHIDYDDDSDEEWLDLLQPSKKLPAWEVKPFTSDRFGF